MDAKSGLELLPKSFDQWLLAEFPRIPEVSLESMLVKYIEDECVPLEKRFAIEPESVSLLRTRIIILENSSHCNRPEVIEWVEMMKGMVELYDESSGMREAINRTVS